MVLVSKKDRAKLLDQAVSANAKINAANQKASSKSDDDLRSEAKKRREDNVAAGKNADGTDKSNILGDAIGALGGFLGGATGSLVGSVEKGVGDAGNLIAGAIAGEGLDTKKASETTFNALKASGQVDSNGKINPFHLDPNNKAVQFGQGVGEMPEDIVKGGVKAAGNTIGNIYDVGKTAIDQQNAGNTASAGRNQIKFINEQEKAGKLSAADAKKQRDDIMSKVNKTSSDASKQTSASSKIDPKQAAADAANTALLGLSGGGKAVEAGAKAVGDTVVPQVLKKLGATKAGKFVNDLTGDSLLGAGSNVAAQLQANPNSSEEELISAAQQGATFGAGGKIASSIFKGARSKFGSKEPTTPQEAAPGLAPKQEATQAELDAISSKEPTYLQDNGFIKQKDNYDELANGLVNTPERIQARHEAAQKVLDAADEVQKGNDLRLSSPYHRSVDKLDTAKADELERLDQEASAMSAPIEMVDQARQAIEEKYAPEYDKLAQKYPQEAMDKPTLDQAHIEATKQHMDAKKTLAQVTDEDAKALQDAHDTLHEPDQAAIDARTQELADTQKSINDRMDAAHQRAIAPQDVSEVNQHINDVADPELNPQNFDESGNLKKEAAPAIQAAAVTRAEMSVEGPDTTLYNPTRGDTAPNATISRIMGDAKVPEETKGAITNLTHQVHNDKLLVNSSKKLVGDNIDEAQKLFESNDLATYNPDSQVHLGNALVDAYNASDNAEMAGKVYDALMTTVGNAARGTRSAGAISKISPQGIVGYAQKFADAKGQKLQPETIAGLQEAAKTVAKMKDGPEKEAAIRELLDNAQQKGIWEKSKDIFSAIASIPRTLMTSADFSFGLRQGAILGARYPKIWAKAEGLSAKFAVDEKFFKQYMDQIENSTDKNGHALMPLYKDMGLSIEGVLGRSEETFGNTSILESNIAKKAVVGHIVAGSDRAFTGAATVLRANVAKKIINDYGGVAEVSKWTKKEKQDLGRVIDTATGRGRGKQNGMFEKAAPVLGQTLFSARLWKSRLDTLNPAYYAKLSPQARKVALQSAGSFASIATATLAAAAAAGADVETDPRSSDFGKIKVGDTRYDILGGLQQNIVLAARELAGETKSSTTGDITKLGDSAFGPDRLSILTDFISNKESPLVSTGSTLLKGTDRVGNVVDPWKEIAKLFIPLGVQDTAAASDNNGGDVLKGAITASPGFFGVGATTYGNASSGISKADEKKVQAAPAGEEDQYKTFYTAANNITGRTQANKKITDLFQQGEPEKARRKAAEFNDMVDQKMTRYYDKYPDIDPDLLDELNSNLYINLTTRGEKQRAKQ